CRHKEMMDSEKTGLVGTLVKSFPRSRITRKQRRRLERSRWVHTQVLMPLANIIFNVGHGIRDSPVKNIADHSSVVHHSGVLTADEPQHASQDIFGGVCAHDSILKNI